MVAKITDRREIRQATGKFRWGDSIPGIDALAPRKSKFGQLTVYQDACIMETMSRANWFTASCVPVASD